MSDKVGAHTARRTKRSFTTWLAAVAGTVALVATCLAFGASPASGALASSAPAVGAIAHNDGDDCREKVNGVDVLGKWKNNKCTREDHRHDGDDCREKVNGVDVLGKWEDGKCKPKPCREGYVRGHNGECVPIVEPCPDVVTSSHGGDRTICPTPIPTPTPTIEYCADGVTPITDGCPSRQVSFTQSATVGGSIDLCLVDGTTNLVVAYSGTGSGTSGISDADAIFIANTNANAAAAADLAAKTPAGATEGACGAPLAVAAVEAATVPEEPIVVAAPEPATVPEAEPVSVPQAATVPTAVPAGDGSSDRSGPNSGLLILALVATGVCFLATGRLLATRNR